MFIKNINARGMDAKINKECKGNKNYIGLNYCPLAEKIPELHLIALF